MNSLTKNSYNLILLLTLLAPINASGKSLTFSLPNIGGNEQVIQRLKEVYKSIGVELVFRKMPSERALVAANRGVVDGEIMRIEGLEKKYQNLVPTKVPITVMSISLFSLKQEPYTDLSMLDNSRTGYLRGIKLSENLLEGKRSYASNSIKSVFSMLLKGRVDYVLAPAVSSLEFLKKADPSFASVKRLQPDVRKVYLYHYLHKKNAKILESFNKALEPYDPIQL